MTDMSFSFGDVLRYGLIYLTDKRGAAPLILGILGICIAGYLIGGVNSSIIISKLKYKDDIRNHGSGNAGMTNMLRTYGKGAAAMTLAGDVLKSFIACFIGSIVLGQTGAFLAGFAAVIGHMWPVWFHFKGGKGVLSIAAVTLYCSPALFLVEITIFFIIVAIKKYISLGSVICALIYPILLSRFIGTSNFVIIPAAVIAFIIVWRHRSNIKRLYSGTESKIKLTKSEKGAPKWVLVTISLVLVAASALTIYFTLIRKTYAVTYGDCKLSSVQLRILFIDEKNKYFGDSEQNNDHDDEIMEKALARAKKIVVYRQTAKDAGFSISDTGSAAAKKHFENLQNLYGYKEGDTVETYCHRIYGNDVSESAAVELLTYETYADEYASETSSPPDINKASVDGKTVRAIKYNY